jgi:hypothetical protein
MRWSASVLPWCLLRWSEAVLPYEVVCVSLARLLRWSEAVLPYEVVCVSLARLLIDMFCCSRVQDFRACHDDRRPDMVAET